MPKVTTPARIAGFLAVVATVLCLGLGSSANAGTLITEIYCTNVAPGGLCVTNLVNIPDWTYYTRAEMQGRHCASGMNSRGYTCGTANYVYSRCWIETENPKYAWGRNESAETRNMQVILFHSTGEDCTP